MHKKLMIVGASGHGKVIADIAHKNGYDDICFLDDNVRKKECAGCPVIGTSGDAIRFADCDFIVGIGANTIRKKVQMQLAEQGLKIVSLIHPNAVIADDVVIGSGTVIMAGAVVNPATVIGKGCIINTGATVDHDNIIADFVHISVGGHLAGTVKIGEGTMIGAGAVLSNNVRVCGGTMVGAGTVVIRDIKDCGTYVGVPARKIK